MKFEVLHAGLFGRPDVIAVDTVHRPGLWGPCFTHHRPHNNHPRYAADTSTEGVLRFLASPETDLARFGAVTTNHFDADALLAVWSLLEPREALARRSLLQSVARCGDLFLCTDAQSLQATLALEALHRNVRGHGQRGERHVEDEVTRRCFAEALPVIGALLDAPQRYEHLWAEPLRAVERDLERLGRPGRITELWDRHTSLVETDTEIENHALNTACKNDLLLSWPTGDGPIRLQLRPALAWYELASMPHAPRYDLDALARRLQTTGNGEWRLQSGAGWLSARKSGGGPAKVLDAIADWLADEPEQHVGTAYRVDVQQVFRHWPQPACQRSHERFLGSSAVRYRPNAPYQGLHPLGAGSTADWQAFSVSDDFHWNRRAERPLVLELRVEGPRDPPLQVEYDAWEQPCCRAEPQSSRKAAKDGALRFALPAARLAASLDGADLRLRTGGAKILELELSRT